MSRRAGVRLTAPELVMAPERSHAHARLGHQLYPILEQCRKPEVLWAKLATGNGLGIRRHGKYVPGRPRSSTVMPEEPAVAPDDATDAHRVEFLSPLQRTPRWEAHRSPEEAREAFQRMVDGDPITPLRSSEVQPGA